MRQRQYKGTNPNDYKILKLLTYNPNCSNTLWGLRLTVECLGCVNYTHYKGKVQNEDMFH